MRRCNAFVSVAALALMAGCSAPQSPGDNSDVALCSGAGEPPTFNQHTGCCGGLQGNPCEPPPPPTPATSCGKKAGDACCAGVTACPGSSPFDQLQCSPTKHLCEACGEPGQPCCGPTGGCASGVGCMPLRRGDTERLCAPGCGGVAGRCCTDGETHISADWCQGGQCDNNQCP